MVDYKGDRVKVDIICKEHGVFQQFPYAHELGMGCSRCKMSHGERIIADYLNDHNIVYEVQKKFDKCKYKRKLPFDFYLPFYNMCIEFDGKLHYESVKYYEGEEHLIEIQKKDDIKNKFCLNEGIILLRIPYEEMGHIKNILNNHLKM